MRKRLLPGFTLLVLLFSAKSACATSYTWTGLGGNSNWNNNANWSPSTGSPGSGDVAQIGVVAFTGTQPTINATGLSCSSLSIGNTTAVTLTVSNPFTVSGATTINGSATITGGSTLSGGSLTINAFVLTLNTPVSLSGSTTVNGGTVNGNSAATITTTAMSLTSATVTLNGALTCSGVVQAPSPGGTACTLTTNATGNTLGGIYDHTGSDLTWNGSGTSTCSQGDVSSGQTLTIGSGNTINFTGSFTLHASAIDGNLVNNGNITMTNASLTSNNLGSGATTPITNNAGAKITLTGSTAQLSAGSYTNISNSGTIIAGSGSSVNIGGNGTLTNNSGGAINLTGATLSLSSSAILNNTGSITAITTSAITTANPATITNNSGGSIALTASTLTLSGVGTLTNSGTITAGSSSTITTNNPTTVTNNTTGAITLTGSALNLNGGTTVTNSGAINGNATSTITCNNPVPITNNSTGTISLSASTLTLNGGSNITNSGSVSAGSSSTITFFNPSYINSTTSGSSITVSASTLNIGAGGYITNSGTFTTSTGANVQLNGNPAYITNNVNSTFTAASTTFTMVGGTTFTNTGGTVNVSSSAFNCSGNPTTIINQNSGATTGTFTVSATSFTFSGSNALNNYGTFTIYNGSSVNMNSSSTSSSITNYGAFYAGTSNSSCIITLNGNQPKINNSSTVVSGTTIYGYFVLGSTSIIYPTSTNCLVTNNSSCTAILQSDAFGSAAIGAVPVGANPSPSLAGTFNVQRYFQGGSTKASGRWVYRNYRMISSPVNTGSLVNSNYIWGLNYIVGSTAGQTTAANSTTNAFITGATGGSTTAGNPSTFLYRENKVPSNATFTSGNFVGITDITSASSLSTTDAGSWTIPVGNGVFFFLRGNASSFTTRTTYPYIAPENVTLTATGTLNQGQVTVKDWFTPASSTLSYTTGIANTAVRGFNMVGNPYACSIDWNAAYSATGITRTNVNPTIWAFNPVTNQYDTYITTSSSGGVATGNASNIIASGQGFFVQANAAGASIVFNEAAKSAVSQVTGSNLLMGNPAGENVVQQMMRLKLVADSINADDLVIGFNPSASLKYSGMEDARYFPGVNAVEGLSSFSADSVPLAINFMPLPKQTRQVIRLLVTAKKSGLYTLERTVLTAVPQIYELWLMDNYKKDSLDIRKNTTYAFNMDVTDTASFGSNRFQVVICQNPALAVHLLDFTATKAIDGAQVIWKTENEQNYTYFTVERSTNNGTTFKMLGGFTAYAAGTYSLLDKDPFPVGGVKTTDQYRLKMEDLNGTVSYSNVVTLVYSLSSLDIVNSNIVVYPNPATSAINVTINPTTVSLTANLSTLQTLGITPGVNTPKGSPVYGIKIININGATVNSATSSSAYWQCNVGNLSPGTYFIQVVNNSNNSLVGKTAFIKL